MKAKLQISKINHECHYCNLRIRGERTIVKRLLNMHLTFCHYK